MRKRDAGGRESREDRISEEASGWIAKRDRGFTPEEQDRFFEWLNEDEEHRDVYRRRLAFWDGTRLLADWRPSHSEEPNPDLLAARGRPALIRWMWAISSAAAALVLGLVVFNVWWQDDEHRSVMLDLGLAQSYQNEVLPDGSVVEMNAGTRVSVQYSRDRRMIFLREGEAHFTVAKDAARPFLVNAGDAVVEATGTAFNVALNETGIEVLVTEGRVRLNSVQPSLSPLQIEPRQSVLAELVAGQRSVMSGDTRQSVSKIEMVAPEEIANRLAWKGEVLDFTETPLDEVVEAFNRRNLQKVIIGDPAIRDLEITAKLHSSNLTAFVQLLSVTMGVEAEMPTGVSDIVLHKKR